MTSSVEGASSDSQVLAAAPALSRPPLGKTAIVGAGPAGLATALMLLRKGWKDITIYDRLSGEDLEAERTNLRSKRSYNIGLNGRGQVALAKLGAMERVKQYSLEVRGRKEWGPKGSKFEEREFTDRRYFTRVLLRNNLVRCLREEVEAQAAERDAVVNFVNGIECIDALWARNNSNRVTLSLSNSKTKEFAYQKTFDFVVGVDGAASSIREAIIRTQEQEKVQTDVLNYERFTPSNTRVYRTLLLNLPEGWRYDVNYAARGDDSREILFDALPLDERTLLGAVLSRPGHPKMQNLDKTSARALIRELFPQFDEMASDESIEEFASKGESRLPEFSFCDGALHHLNSTVLLGDAIHTVKPYFGLGVNSAFEDVITLAEIMDKNDPSTTENGLQRALSSFSKDRGPNARALVELSRSFDRDTRNPLNLLSFVLPLVLDSTFHRFLPGLFERTTLGLLQDERYSFKDVVERKRRDRILQVLAMVSVLSVVANSV